MLFSGMGSVLSKPSHFDKFRNLKGKLWYLQLKMFCNSKHFFNTFKCTFYIETQKKLIYLSSTSTVLLRLSESVHHSFETQKWWHIMKSTKKKWNSETLKLLIVPVQCTYYYNFTRNKQLALINVLCFKIKI